MAKCAIVIGHKPDKPGAKNIPSGISEFEFNDDLARRIEDQVRNVETVRVFRQTRAGLPGDINALQPDFVISLHCNAFEPNRASGTEVIHYENSTKGRRLAEVVNKHLVNHLGLRDRGLHGRDVNGRGGQLLHGTNAPCVIAEPFFIDNDSDLARAQSDLDGLAGAYAAAIEEYAKI